MALTFTAGPAYASTAGVTSAVVTLPAGLSDGDYVLLVCGYVASAGTINAPAGYSALLPSTDTTTGSTSGHHAIFYKKWASGDANPTVTVSATGRLCVLPVKVTGADPTTFIDTAPSIQHAANAQTSVTSPSITPGAPALVTSYFARSGTNGVILAFTSPPEMTEVGQAAAASTSSTNGTVLLATQSITPGVATGTRTATASANVSGAMGVSFAIKEATAAAPAQGAASGSWAFTGAASGQTTRAGSAAGSWAFTGSATGTAPTIGANSGTATGTWSFVGAATGTTSRSGTASGAWAFTGTATGAAPSTAPPPHLTVTAVLAPSAGPATLAGNGAGEATVDHAAGTATLTSDGTGTATVAGVPALAELQLT